MECGFNFHCCCCRLDVVKMKDEDYDHVIMDVITKFDLSIYKDFGKLEEKRK